MAYVHSDWLDAVTADAVTDPEEVTGARTYGLQVRYTGSPTGGSAFLEGSIDGVTWMILASASVATNHTIWGVDKPVKYIRLRLAGLSGGTSPTFSASVIAV